MNCLDLEDPLDLLLEDNDFLPDMKNYHTPVLAEEVGAFLRPAPGILFLDGTLGGGGHSELLLQAGASVIALDRDGDAITHATERLAGYGQRFVAIQANFAEAEQILDRLGVTAIGGALFDIGVSSHQLDHASRGFSLLREGPLDMRMGPDAICKASDLVNDASAEELIRIFRDYGEERAAARIANYIVDVRNTQPIFTTTELAEVVARIVPRTGKRHPATRIFQALRIAVNDELGALERGLEGISRRLARGGRFGVITFHSLEDRIVKHWFKRHSTEWIDRPEWPEPRRNPDRICRLLTPHPIDPCPDEVEQNPRARSAKLRVVERL
jgi:16S rRNA (cytosine1402-N4)-methyltransferase